MPRFGIRAEFTGSNILFLDNTVPLVQIIFKWLLWIVEIYTHRNILCYLYLLDFIIQPIIIYRGIVIFTGSNCHTCQYQAVYQKFIYFHVILFFALNTKLIYQISTLEYCQHFIIKSLD